jgi:CubicO group peptidase (beta-lactamase class C family)
MQEEPPGISELESYLAGLVSTGRKSPPGMSVVVARSSGVVYQQAFGYADGPNAIKATPDTVYNFWSMTKPFTAVAIMQLVERGLIDLDTPVAEILDFFIVEYPSQTSEEITVLHLLNHSSGLSNNVPEVIGWVHTDGGRDWNQTELIRNKLPDYAELDYEPGSQGIYTNVGYMVLASVIEKIAGVTYEEYIRASILEPLGMDLTDFTYTPEMISREAVGAHPRFDFMALLLPFLVNDPKSLIREKTGGRIWFNHVYSDQNGPTGLIGPSTDVARFLVSMLNNVSVDNHMVLESETLHAMFREHWVSPGKSPETSRYKKVSHGIGWFVFDEEGETYFGHNGGGPGFATGMRVYPESDLAIVIMSNGTHLPTDEVLNRLASVDW